jgi:hypothetical protein
VGKLFAAQSLRAAAAAHRQSDLVGADTVAPNPQGVS